MTVDDLQTGDAVFVAANTLIYHFTNHSKYGAVCTRLLERIEKRKSKASPIRTVWLTWLIVS
jgi:hypothetical protein